MYEKFNSYHNFTSLLYCLNNNKLTLIIFITGFKTREIIALLLKIFFD